MEQHAIPRQITNFEFKLIGFMTLKQFLYLLVFIPTGFVVFKLVPIPILNILLAAIIAGFGFVLGFVPINDRPMEVWIRNLIKRLRSPTQYFYQKENKPLYFLRDLYFASDPHKVLAHVESKEKLAEYLQRTQVKPVARTQKNQIQSLLHKPTDQLHIKAQVPAQASVQHPVQTSVPVPAPVSSSAPLSSQVTVTSTPSEPQQQVTYQRPTQIQPAQPLPQDILSSIPVIHHPQTPFLTGLIKNSKQIPLPGILVYIKNTSNAPVRLLKTNPHGVFATYSPLPSGQYTFEIKDPNGGYFFDTMKVDITSEEKKPYEFYSKEIL